MVIQLSTNHIRNIVMEEKLIDKLKDACFQYCLGADMTKAINRYEQFSTTGSNGNGDLNEFFSALQHIRHGDKLASILLENNTFEYYITNDNNTRKVVYVPNPSQFDKGFINLSSLARYITKHQKYIDIELAQFGSIYESPLYPLIKTHILKDLDAGYIFCTNMPSCINGLYRDYANTIILNNTNSQQPESGMYAYLLLSNVVIQEQIRNDLWHEVLLQPKNIRYAMKSTKALAKYHDEDGINKMYDEIAEVIRENNLHSLGILFCVEYLHTVHPVIDKFIRNSHLSEDDLAVKELYSLRVGYPKHRMDGEPQPILSK